jgi:glycerol-3-phosphate acyltransferase PlsX
MGSIYYANTMGVEKPRVAIVNIGLEEEKGNQLVKETYPLLKECKDINFIGSIEAREIPNGYADVIVCEAFVGNVILKLYEGTTKALLGIVKQSFYSNLRSKIGGMLVKPALKKTMKKLMADEYGSAPLLGLNGLVLKTHGSATAKEIKNSLLQALDFKKQKINEKIKDSIMINDSWEE